MDGFYFLQVQNGGMKGNKTYTMLKKNDPFMEGFRKWGFMALNKLVHRVEKKRWKHPSSGMR